ncbi:DNA internalization-related competence protein ComEC/Rec2 [Actinomyces slackii]|uniref:DNA internalization-related competence protein ComEC/Rec2 n=1 Tax=Actinomyces slackii TaxID=52774 RepID=A0A3S4U2M7_9ACTO|nr:DNA internalization-related competence protein ComEC/Rec2 [Actinomyces slackii]
MTRDRTAAGGPASGGPSAPDLSPGQSQAAPAGCAPSRSPRTGEPVQVPPAAWDDPAILSALGPEPATAPADKAPEALDLRLAVPALSAWAAAAWAVGRTGAAAWQEPAAAALAALGVAALLAAALCRFRPPRHRADPRPGAPEGEPASMGTPTASLMVCCLAAASALAVSSAQVWARQQDPLTEAAEQGRSATLIGTIAQQPRVIASARATTVLTVLDVASVDGAASGLSATVLGGQEWADLDMGAQVRVRTSIRPAEPGSAQAALIGRGSPRLLAPASGTLGAVASLRQGLARAAGTGQAGPWPEGARELVPGIALGDDHALPAGLRQDMRAVSMTHLTAVSGQHVAIVLGLSLTALGVLPSRWRALTGAVVLAALVVLVRPSGSVLRSAAMGSVMLVGVAAGRRAAALPALFGGVIVLLLADPWQSRDYGFALSVAATAGILLASRPATAALSQRLPGWLAALIALPLVAQAACAPILILLQPAVGLWSVPANALAAPVVPLATVLGLMAALIAPLWPQAGAALAWPAVVACSWLVLLARFFAGLPGAQVAWPAGLPGAAGLAALEAAALVAASRRARSGLARVWKAACHGRLGPWHPPAHRALVAHGRPPARPGIRSSSPPSSSSARARRSWPTGRWPVSWLRPGTRTPRRRSRDSRPPLTSPTSSTPSSHPRCSASPDSSSSPPWSR